MPPVLIQAGWWHSFLLHFFDITFPPSLLSPPCMYILILWWLFLNDTTTTGADKPSYHDSTHLKSAEQLLSFKLKYMPKFYYILAWFSCRCLCLVAFLSMTSTTLEKERSWVDTFLSWTILNFKYNYIHRNSTLRQRKCFHWLLLIVVWRTELAIRSTVGKCTTGEIDWLIDELLEPNIFSL